jgi:BirA family biotin operon repressor/biotin-[acetyl-CoA-carboxylase] ligase
VGLNVNLSRSDTAAIDQPWIDLFSIVGEVNRNQLAAILIEQLYRVRAEFLAEGFTRLREEWSRYDVFASKAVKVQLGDKYIEGLACGVDGTGGLVLQTAAGQQVFYGGEVSLRGI